MFPVQKTTPNVAMQFKQTKKEQERWRINVPGKAATHQEEAEASPEEHLNKHICI